MSIPTKKKDPSFASRSDAFTLMSQSKFSFCIPLCLTSKKENAVTRNSVTSSLDNKLPLVNMMKMFHMRMDYVLHAAA